MPKFWDHVSSSLRLPRGGIVRCARSGGASWMVAMETLLPLLLLIPPPLAGAAPGGCPGPEPCLPPCSPGRSPELPWPIPGWDPPAPPPASLGPGRDLEPASLGGSPGLAWAPVTSAGLGWTGWRRRLPFSPALTVPSSSCPDCRARPGGAALPAGAGPLQLRDLRQRDLPAAVPGLRWVPGSVLQPSCSQPRPGPALLWLRAEFLSA